MDEWPNGCGTGFTLTISATDMTGAYGNSISNQYLNVTTTGGAATELICTPSACPDATIASISESPLNTSYGFLYRYSQNSTTRVKYGVQPTLGVDIQPYTPVVNYSGTYNINLQY
ncbi:MAG: hypothetical protein H6765_10260 [Candidatus Peribacteria bacterium]|nr:MAG: hypothetical protein H6765_10260 [Candidatus Peribacteria bacterium]